MTNPNVPILKVEVGFAAGIRDALSTVVWADVTDTLNPVDISRGRQPELGGGGTFEAGTCTLTIREDHASKFDPNNTGSVGGIGPARVNNRLRVSATLDGGTTWDRLFCGYVWDWGYTLRDTVTGDVRVQAADAFRLLNKPNLAPTPIGVEVLKDRPTAWYRLGEGMGETVMSDSSGNQFHGNYQGDPGLGLPGLIPGDPNTAFGPVRSVFNTQAGTIPYKTLIKGFPFTIECWLRCAAQRTAFRQIFGATGDAQSYDHAIGMSVPDSASAGANGGRVRLTVRSAAGASTSFYSGQYVDDGNYHHVVCIAHSPTSISIYVDAVDTSFSVVAAATGFPTDLLTGYAIGNTTAPTFGDFAFATQPTDALQDLAIYDGVELSSARITAHHNAGASWMSDAPGTRINRLLDVYGWPSADRSIDSGGSFLQAASFSGSVLNAMQAAAESDSGALFVTGSGVIRFAGRWSLMTSPGNVSKGTFGPGALPYSLPISWGRDDLDLINDAAGERRNGIRQTWVDASSQNQFGPSSPFNRSFSELANDADVLYAVQYVVSRNSTPSTRINSVTLRPDQDANLWPHVIRRELQDRITLSGAAPGGSSWSGDFIIEHTHHTISATEPWTTEWVLSPADPNSYWIIGSSAIGSGTRVAY